MKKIGHIFLSNYRSIYLGLLFITAAAMPHSRALLSSSMILLASIYILEGDYKKKLSVLKERRSVLILTSIFLIHIIGLIWTTDFHYALNDLKIKLPLLLFPIVIGTSRNLQKRDIKYIILAFSLSLLAKTIIGYLQLSGISNKELTDIHLLAGNFSHIRYALMLNISIVSLLWLLLNSNIREKLIIKILYLVLILWFCAFLVILQSVTGWIILLFTILYTLLYVVFKSKSKILKLGSSALIIFALSSIILYLYHSVSKYNYVQPVDLNKLELYTESKNPYKHVLNIKDRENGYYVYLYICEEEMREEWNKISTFNYDSKDLKGQEIKFTLIRYLTSKGLTKDKAGIEMLDQRDLENVEAGLTNIIFVNKYSLYPKIYEILWQIEQYHTGKNPEGHSITQRLEFLKIAFKIFEENILLGVGTGDLRSEYNLMYEKTHSQLSREYRLRAHNQLVTFSVMFGIIGFLWILFAFISPGIFEKKFRDHLFTSIFIILTISMLNEDTLETQMGVGIFAFFFCIYLFYSPTDRKIS